MRMRSTRLLSAPPRMRERPTPASHCSRRVFHTTPTTVASSAAEMTTNSAVFQGAGESANSPNAAPSFLTCVMLNNPGITGMTWRSGIEDSTIALVDWSPTKTSRAMAA